MNRGDVVLVDWPYSDGTGFKLRPAIVVQADFLNGLIDDTILVQISSKRHGIPNTEVRIDPSVESGSGLHTVSFVGCVNLLTIDQTHIVQIIGFISDSTIQQIEQCLKSVLEIP